MAELKRRGETDKCPACGTRLDEGAYRCPKCRIYFCYKCRARIAKDDRQYECANQSCPCYGKLVCSACVVSVGRNHDVRNADATFVTLVVGVVAGIVALMAGAHFLLAAAVGIAGVVAAHSIARKMGYNAWGSKDSHVEVVGRHLSCVECRQPAKDLTQTSY